MLKVGASSWWRVDGNANDTAGANHGTLYNGTYVSGKVGQAFSLFGNAHVRLADSTTLRFSTGTGMTVEAWVYPTAPRGWNGILSKWDAVSLPVGQRSYCFSLDPAGHVYLVASPGGYDAGSASATSTTVLPLDRWTHVAGAFDGTSLHKVIYKTSSLQNRGSGFDHPLTPLTLLVWGAVSFVIALRLFRWQ